METIRIADFQRRWTRMEGAFFIEDFSSPSLLHIRQKKRAERSYISRAALAAKIHD